MTADDLNRLIGDPTTTVLAACHSCRSHPCRCDVTTAATGFDGWREAHLVDAMEWWRSEWEHKNRESEWLWRLCFGLAVLCGVFFFIGTVLG